MGASGGTAGSGAGAGGNAGDAASPAGTNGNDAGGEGEVNDASAREAGTGGAGDAGAEGTAGTGSGGADGAGAGGTNTTGAAGSAGAVGSAGASGTVHGFGGSDITKVVPTMGCGQDPGLAAGTLVMQTIETSGTKAADCADSQCGDWSYTRQYFVRLPVGYDETKAYPLILEGPGNEQLGNVLYALPDLASTVIRIGLTPPPVDIGHSTNPGQGCFDDREGDDSVDFVFYEDLYDRLAATLCFDRNRVFAAGRSDSCGGAWLANELGCKYAGDATRPVRGVLVNSGGLPTLPAHAPTCTNNPMAGMWVHAIGNTISAFGGSIVAMNRALTVNGCLPAGVTYSTATFDPFPIGGGNVDTTCKRFTGCPDVAPLVVCPLRSNSTGPNDDVVNPGWTTFIKLFMTPPLLTP
jgi:hypothetical protein